MVLTPTVRPAQPADAAQMVAILNAIISIGGTTGMETPLDLAELRQWFLDGPPVVTAHVALDGAGAVIGFQALGLNERLPAGWGDISTFVDGARAQRGVGTALFAATQAAARAAGLRMLNATIRADNSGGLAYYRKLGFEEYRVSRAVPLADGTPVDRLQHRFAL